MDDADVLKLAESGSYWVVTAHLGDVVQLVFGDPASLFAVDSDSLVAGGFAALLVGEVPAPCAWTEACESCVYLIRDLRGGCHWLESRSILAPDNRLVVSTRLALWASADLMRTARLAMGGGLMGSIAHELNNIVQGVSSAAYLFRDCVEQGDPIETEDIDQLAQSAADLAALGSELQNFAKVSEAECEDLDFAKMLKRSVKLLRASGRLKTVELAIEIPATIPSLRWRRHELDFLLLSLLGNAADAAMGSAAAAHVGVRVVLGDNQQLRLEVSDSGESFSMATWQAPFASSKARHRHLGLGLTAALSLLALRGGSLAVATNESGSCVRATLPLIC